MAEELEDVLDAIRGIVRGVDGIREVHDAEPGAVNAPAAYIPTVDTVHDVVMLGATLVRDATEATVRVLVERTGNSEEKTIRIRRRLVRAFRDDPSLGGTVEESDPVRSSLGYVELGGALYRSADVVIRFDQYWGE